MGKEIPHFASLSGGSGCTKLCLQIGSMLDELRTKYHYGEQDAMLVLKDILYKTWKSRKKNK